MISIVGYSLIKITNEKLKEWGRKRNFHSAIRLKELQQSFKSIREIILNGLESVFVEKYHDHNSHNRGMHGRNKDTVTQLPRLILELVGVSTFLILILVLLNTGNSISETFIIIGVFFFAATRLLPSISSISKSVQLIKYNSVVVDLIYSELVDFNNNKNNRKNDKLHDSNFNFESINFENVNFLYPTNNIKVLNNINIKINKGDKIGIIGKTGTGSSIISSVTL